MALDDFEVLNVGEEVGEMDGWEKGGVDSNVGGLLVDGELLLEVLPGLVVFEDEGVMVLVLQHQLLYI